MQNNKFTPVKTPIAALIGSTIFLSALAAPASAQSTASTTEAGQIDTVTVTATRRSASLQAVPLAVSVVDDARLIERHLR